MNKIKMIYFGLFLIGIFLVSSTYFSYAFLTNKDELHGKLNIVVGTLEYKIESSDLHDNSISIPSGDTKIITLSVKSLNDVASKYELYYKLENDNALVTVGFLEDSLNTKSGTLENYESKKVEVIIRNKSDSSQKIIFGVEGGLINNDLVLNDNKSSLVDYCSKEDIYTFDYNGTNGNDGSSQEFITPCSGGYQLETWGAQGGSYNAIYVGGYGGYSAGEMKFIEGEKLYVNIGGQPINNTTVNTFVEGGYNGGGSVGTRADLVDNAGGGATHIALKSGVLSKLNNSVSYVLIVSGGGGGSQYISNPSRASVAGHGGGVEGNSATTLCTDCDCESIGTGGTQESGGYRNIISYNTSVNNYATNFSTGLFCLGSNGDSTPMIREMFNQVGGSGGGGGFYGGSGNSCVGAGGGGSGYIGNSLLTNKVMYCYECEESSEESTKTVSTTNVSEEPISNFAKIGNGYAKITYLGK